MAVELRRAAVVSFIMTLASAVLGFFVLPWILGLGSVPDISLLTATAFSMTASPLWGAWTGYVGGLIGDLLSQQSYIGASALSASFTAYACGAAARCMSFDGSVLRVFISGFYGALAVLSFELARAALVWIAGGPASPWSILAGGRGLGSSVLSGSVIFAIIYPLVARAVKAWIFPPACEAELVVTRRVEGSS